MSNYEEFAKFRQELNNRILAEGHLEIKRFFALDEKIYREGALTARTKELLGLVASLVLRCDDCIQYHLIQCCRQKVKDAELFDAFSVALVVGGSIVIPHLRRAVAFLDDLRAKTD